MQRRKLALLADIRKATDDPALELLDEKARADLARLRPPESLRVLRPPICPRWPAGPSPRPTGPSAACC